MKRLIILILIVVPGFLSAQNGGSVYTKRGVGDIYHSYTPRRIAMGELGAALIDDQNLNIYNPASLSGLNLTRFEIGVNFVNRAVEDNNSNVTYSKAEFTGFMIGFPVSQEYGVGTVFGITPYSDVEYDVIKSVPASGSIDSYELEQKGTGGLSKIFIGSSYRTPIGISIGAAFEYYTGKIETDEIVTFNSNSTFDNSFFVKEYRYKGTGYTFGIISNNLAEFLDTELIKDLRFGVTYNYVNNLDTDTADFYSSSLGTIQKNSGLTVTSLPSRLGAGISINLSNKYTFTGDYAFQPWSDYSNKGNYDNELRDLNKFSFGFEYSNPDRRYGSFWELMKLRGGLTFEQTQYFINGEGIDKLMFTGGFTIPLSYSNVIDITLGYGFRGTTNNNLLKEKLFTISSSLSIGDLWFESTRRR